jgi:uncharacterized protein YbaA (DUF1428 family)
MKLSYNAVRSECRAWNSASVMCDSEAEAPLGLSIGLLPLTGRGRMSYIDGFAAAVPTANREKYRKHAEEAAKVFKEYGALKVVECWGDDIPDGQVTSFPMAVKRQDDETVVLSWVLWPSKEARKAAWEKIMSDPRMQPDRNQMPFDGKRLIYGGFELLLER